MNALTTNPAEVIAQMVADHLQCDSLTIPEIEELLMLLHRCVFDGNYHALGIQCARALLAQLRGQVLARKHIGIVRMKP